jgi:two-component system NtrC family sensor kinase
MKFILPITAMLVLNMLIIGGYLVKRQSDSFLRELESSGYTMSKLLAINAESGVLFESRYELNEILGTIEGFEGVEFAIIANNDGDTLAQIGKKEAPSTPEHLDSLIEQVKNEAHIQYRTDNFGTEVMVIATPIITQKKILNREHLGITGGFDNSMSHTEVSEVIGCLELGLSLEGVNKSIVEATTATILVTILVVISTFVVITMIISAITKPVTELVEVTNQVSMGDLSRKVEIHQRDEIGQLAKTFNKMIESLKQSRDEIEQYSRNLEDKIIERTHQLEEAQAQLIQSEKLSAIGQLAAGVAHELNNPLGGILGYAQFTLEKLHKNSPEETSRKEIDSYIRYVTDIEAQARRCKTIVQNLLRFSRSSQSVDFEDIDINKAIGETITFVEHQLHLNQIELKVSCDPKLPTVQGNLGQLQQVFTNLIINAMHASDPNSTIEIVTRYSPALGEFDGTVELQFIDHGCGIKQENLKKVFEPFFTTKDIGKGTGLGLSVSYGIIKAHQGEITVSSAPGRGTTFSIILPVQKPAAEPDIYKRTSS